MFIEPSPRRCFVVLALVSLLCGAGHLPPIYAQTTQTAATAAPESGAAQISVSGVVRGPDNKPVAGATVVWYMFFVVADDELVPTATTDANGRFTLSIPSALLQKIPKDPENKFMGAATAYAPGFGVASGNLERGGENALVLVKPAQIRGKVVGGNAPLANARVSVSYLMTKSGTQLFMPPTLRSHFSAQTDKNGAWQINDLPEGGKVHAGVESKGWTSTGVDALALPIGSPSSDADLEMAQLTVSVPVSGRVVDGAGKPVSGVSVVADGTRTREAGSASGNYESNHAEAKTDALGSYRFDGLAPGVITVRVSGAPDAPLVAVAQTGITLAREKAVTVPDLVMTPGGVIKGMLVDADTNLPITDGAMIGGNGPHLPRPANGGGTVFAVNIQSDGTFTLRTPPGKIDLYIMGLPSGYLASDDGQGNGEKTLTVSAGQTQTGTFGVRKGRILTGTLLDDANQPIGGVQVRLGAEWDGYSATSDAKGAFKIIGLPRTAKKLTLAVDGNWAVTPPTETYELSADNADLSPLTLHIKRAARRQIAGRVLTPKGEPVEGATVRARVRVERGDGAYSYTTDRGETSDANGNFTLTNIAASSEVFLEGEKTGYRWLSGGLTSPPPSDAVPAAAASVVMTPLTLRVEGTVVGESGAPVAGARVFAPESVAGIVGQVTTDAKGHFVLSGLPQGLPPQIAAYTKTAFGIGGGRSASQTGPLVVTLEPAAKPSPPGDIDAAIDLLTALQTGAGGAGKDYLAGELETIIAPYNPDRALAFASPPGKPVSEGRLSYLLRTVAERRPDRFSDWVLPHLPLIKDEASRAESAAQCIVQVPPSMVSVSVVETAYRNLQGFIARGAINGDANSELMNAYFESSRMLNLATLAARLQKPAEASAYLVRAVAAAKRLPANRQEGWWGAMAEAVASGGDGGALVRTVVKQTPEASKTDVYARAIPVVAQSSVSAAAQLFVEMSALPSASSGNDRFRVDSARLAVARAGAKNDSALALRVAREISGARDKAQALAYIAYFLPTKDAAPIFAEAVAPLQGGSGASELAQIAAMAYERSPVQGAAFFRDARAHLGDEAYDLAHFAYFYARYAPAEARVLLEGAWASVQARGAGNPNFEWESKTITEAMMALDVERAKEMAQKIPDHQNGGDTNPRADTLHKIAAYLAADAKTRRTTRLDNWGPNDRQRGPW